MEQPIDSKIYVSHESFSLTILLVALAVLFSGFWLYESMYKSRIKFFELARKLPGPSGLPLLGNILQLATAADDSLDRLYSIATSYQTPMRLWLGPKLIVLLSEPRDYEVVMQSPNATHKDWTYKFMATYVGNGLVTASGPYHRAQRKLVAPMTSARALNGFMEYFNYHSRVCVQKLAEQIGKGEFNVQHYLAQCTWDFTTETVLGVPSSVQTSDDKSCVQLSERMYALVYERSTKIWFHSDYLFSFSSMAKDEKTGRDMFSNFSLGVLDQKKREYLDAQKRSNGDHKPKSVIMEQLIAAVMESNLMSDQEIKDCIMTVFTAAQDTTAVICAFALLHLAIDPEIQDKVRREIEEVVGNDDVSIEHTRELKYVDMVLRETIRLYPIGPVLQRVATDDVALDNCVIPKGCTITMVPYVTHRSDKYWDEPESFIPERFLPENSIARHPYAYAPFSYGARSCIGQQYAMTSMKVMISHIVRAYRLSTTTKPRDIRVKMDVSVRSRVGYNVSLTRV